MINNIESKVRRIGKNYLLIFFIFLSLFLFSTLVSAGLGLSDPTKPKLENPTLERQTGGTTIIYANSSFNSTYNNILNQQCPANQYAYYVQSNGTILCRTDQTGGGGGNVSGDGTTYSMCMWTGSNTIGNTDITIDTGTNTQTNPYNVEFTDGQIAIRNGYLYIGTLNPTLYENTYISDPNQFGLFANELNFGNLGPTDERLELHSHTNNTIELSSLSDVNQIDIVGINISSDSNINASKLLENNVRVCLVNGTNCKNETDQLWTANSTLVPYLANVNNFTGLTNYFQTTWNYVASISRKFHGLQNPNNSSIIEAFLEVEYKDSTTESSEDVGVYVRGDTEQLDTAQFLPYYSSVSKNFMDLGNSSEKFRDGWFSRNVSAGKLLENGVGVCLTNGTGCVASGTTPPRIDYVSFGGYAVLTNIGATYDATDPPKGLGLTYMNMTNVNDINCTINVNKIGTGVQNWTLFDITGNTELIRISDSAGAGAKALTGRNTTVSLTGERILRWKALSSVSTDDPLWFGAGCIFRRSA